MICQIYARVFLHEQRPDLGGLSFSPNRIFQIIKILVQVVVFVLFWDTCEHHANEILRDFELFVAAGGCFSRSIHALMSDKNAGTNGSSLFVVPMLLGYYGKETQLYPWRNIWKTMPETSTPMLVELVNTAKNTDECYRILSTRASDIRGISGIVRIAFFNLNTRHLRM